jgi:hypothetical protein
MKAMRRFGFILLVLFLGILIGNFGIQTALLVFAPLFTLWFMLWDDKKYPPNRTAERIMKNLFTTSLTTDPGNPDKKA